MKQKFKARTRERGNVWKAVVKNIYNCSLFQSRR